MPLPFATGFTYLIPVKWRGGVCRGMRVIVPFGKKKVYSGVVDRLHNEEPLHYEAKEIIDLPDDHPIFTEKQLDFMWWLADYYMCGMGDALQAALPAGFKVSSQAIVQINPDYDLDDFVMHLPERQAMIIEQLRNKGTLTYDEIAALAGLKTPYPVIKALLKEGAILLLEQVKDRYVPKVLKKLRLNPDFLEKEALKSLMDSLEKKTKQLDILLSYLQQVPVFNKPELNSTGLDKATFMDNFSASALQTLVKNGIFQEFTVRVSRIEELPAEEERIVKLSDTQKAARDTILEKLEAHQVVLLHGITGSGKTEILVDLIKEVLNSGHQVLYLMPEIALSTQMAGRLRHFFGDQLGIYHSRYSDNERVEVWNGVLKGRFQLVAGVRSSIFLPFDDLGLIIVDEEHEPSFKQFEPAPRYHARDMALVLARYHSARVILSSATPSLESYHNVQAGKFGMAKLDKRFGDLPLPEIKFAPSKPRRSDKYDIWHFSQELVSEVEAALEKKKQVILFQNRRGYAPYLSCESCGWIPKCTSCAVSLTYHQFSHELRCHYCGYKEQVPPSCKVCESRAVKQVGFGTERVEEEAALLFPNARICRMDLDTTRSRDAYEQLIGDFARHEFDILIGTQMVTKGLDFNNVSLVGVLDADHLIHFPDFRSHERAYQLLSQVAGRAGRKGEKGLVVIQTANPEHHILQFVARHDYEAFVEFEMHERHLYFYPPFSRLITIRVKSPERKECQWAADVLFQHLKMQVPGNVAVKPPHEPLIAKIRNWYQREILMQFGKDIPLRQLKARIKKAVNSTQSDVRFKKIRIILDVDPI